MDLIYPSIKEKLSLKSASPLTNKKINREYCPERTVWERVHLISNKKKIKIGSNKNSK